MAHQTQVGNLIISTQVEAVHFKQQSCPERMLSAMDACFVSVYLTSNCSRIHPRDFLVV